MRSAATASVFGMFLTFVCPGDPVRTYAVRRLTPRGVTPTLPTCRGETSDGSEAKRQAQIDRRRRRGRRGGSHGRSVHRPAAYSAESPKGTIAYADAPNAVEGSYIVTLKSGTKATTAQGKGVAKKHGADVEHIFREAVNGYTVEATEAEAAELAADPRSRSSSRTAPSPSRPRRPTRRPGAWTASTRPRCR